MKLKKINSEQRIVGRVLANQLSAEDLAKVHGGSQQGARLASKGYTDTGSASFGDCDPTQVEK